MKPLDFHQRIFMIEIAATVGALAFIAGVYVRAMLEPITPTADPTIPTVEQAISALPPDVRRAIAIDYCASGKAAHRMCSMLPLSSPIRPMDGRMP